MRILEAATEVFAQRGYDGARVEEIARRAKVSKASLYYHVGDKAALYQAVLADWVRAVLDQVLARSPRGLPPEVRLAVIPEVLGEFLERFPHHPRILLREMAGGGTHFAPLVLDLLTQLLTLEAAILSEGRNLGCFRDVPPFTIHASLVVGTVAQFVARPILEGRFRSGPWRGPFFADNPSASIADLVLHGLLAPPSDAGAPPAPPQEVPP